MSTAAQRAHERLMQSMPVRTHLREEPKHLDPYTGKPSASPLARAAIHRRIMPSRINTYIPPGWGDKRRP